jgi:DNA-binding NarL/FixJ family response regulator
MADPRKKKTSRTGPQQTNRFFHVLATPLRLINTRNPANQETSNTNSEGTSAGGRRSSDRETYDLFDRWWSLSKREREVTYLTCQGYKNHQIAFHMGITVRTVQSYLEHVYLKMGVSSKTELRLKMVHFDFEKNGPYN